MASELRWSRAALDDIDGIAEYLSREAPFYANAVVSRIVARAEASTEFPLAGRPVPEWNDPAYREVFAYSYRIIYRVVGDRVVVTAVIHGRRRLDADADRPDPP